MCRNVQYIAMFTAVIVLAAGCGNSGSTAAGQSVADPGKQACADNLKQLGLGLKLYAAEHDGKCPASLEAIFPEYMPDRTRFFCPSANHPTPDTGSGPLVSDYELIPGVTFDSSSGKVLIQEKSTQNHGPGRRNVQYVNGKVDFVKARS